MDLHQATKLRKFLGKTGALFCLLASLAVLDGLMAKFREPVNVLHVLPGEVVPVDGPIPENIKTTGALVQTGDTPELAIAFEVIHPAYFMGGNMWRGRLTVGPNLAPGKYTVTVKPRDYPAGKPGYDFRVVVYKDPLSQRRGFRSLIKSQTGISPYLVAGAFVPLILIAFGMVYFLSQRIDALRAQGGLAEIYRVARAPDGGGFLVSFGLGTDHGVRPGDQMFLLDPEGNYVGAVQVQESTGQDAVGLVTVDRDLRSGYFVSRSREGLTR